MMSFVIEWEGRTYSGAISVDSGRTPTRYDPGHEAWLEVEELVCDGRSFTLEEIEELDDRLLAFIAQTTSAADTIDKPVWGIR